MELQQILSLVLGIVIACLGWALRELWSSHKQLLDKHHAHALQVAENYVTKDDFKEQLEHIRQTCDNIWKAIRKGE